MKNGDILKEIQKEFLPEHEIVGTFFEGANIILYTRNRKFFLTGKEKIKEVVNKVKKRIELRMDPKDILPMGEAEEIIKKIIPKDAGVKDIWFDEKRSVVLIEALKPGAVIGDNGEVIQKIKEKTLWTPKVQRAPAINSDLIRSIRMTLYEHSEFRRDFLNSIGNKIYHSKWERSSKYFIRASFLGGSREVGRSSILLQTPISNILLDAGVNVASKENEFPRYDAPEFDINKIDAVIISHAHLDHSGALPLLFKYGYRGPVYCTAPTRDTMALLQLDYIDVLQKEGREPPYTSREIKEMIKHTITLNYNEVTDITPDVRLTLLNAGHILGSSMIHLNVGNGYHNILYTGDYKYAQTKLLDPPSTKFQRLETMITESTYGGSNDVQPSREESESQIIEIVNKTIERNGKVLIPVLGVGRAQEVMLILEEAMKEKKIPEVPIYVDGMVWDVTAIYTAYPEFMNKNIRQRIFSENDNPFLSKIFNRVGSNEERQKIIRKRKPCIIVATSGMLTGGASVEYFKALAINKKNSLIFVSYQAEGSLGRQLQNGEREIPIEIEGKKGILKVKMEIYSVEGLSGHSDRNQLMNFARKLIPKPKRIFVVHGETSKSIDLASSLHKLLNVETYVPRRLDALRIR